MTSFHKGDVRIINNMVLEEDMVGRCVVVERVCKYTVKTNKGEFPKQFLWSASDWVNAKTPFTLYYDKPEMKDVKQEVS